MFSKYIANFLIIKIELLKIYIRNAPFCLSRLEGCVPVCMSALVTR